MATGLLFPLWGGRRLLLAALAATLLLVSVGALARPAGALAAGGCSDSWINSSGGAWDTGTNWSTGSAPGSGDSVCITAAGSYTVVVGNETITVASLTVGGSGSTPTLQIGNNGSSFPYITVTGAVDNNSGATIDYGFGGTFSAGSMTNSGTFEVPSTGYGGAMTFGDVTNTGTFSVAGGATLSLTSATTFDNAGGTISNASGTLAVSTPGGPTANFELDSGGTVDNTGTLNVADIVAIDGGSICGNTLNVGASDGGTGGSLAFATTPGTGPACGTGVTKDQVFIYNVSATLSGTIPAGYVVRVGAGGSSFFALALSGDVVNDGAFVPGFGGTVSSPTSSDLLTNNGTVYVPPSGFVTQLNATIDNAHSLIFAASATASLLNGLAWTNASTGTITVKSGTTVALSSPSGNTATLTQDGVIDNSGTFTVADTVFIQGGSICGNTLDLGSGDGGSGATLEFAANPATGPACATGLAKNKLFFFNVTGSIATNLPSGYTVTIGDGGSSYAHVSTPGNFTNSGNLDPGFGATFTVNGAFTNAGTILVPASGYTTAVDATTSTTNTGSIDIYPSTLLVLGGPLTNYNSTTSTLTGGAYNLAGTLQYTDPGFIATGIENDASKIALYGSGGFEDANSANGLRNLASIADGSSLALGANFATVGSLSNAGTLTLPATVTLTVNGSYTQASTGTWSEGITSTTKYAVIDATGTSTLAGTLAIAASSTFTGTGGAVLTPLSSSARTGTFSTVTGTSVGTSGQHLTIAYTATGYTLTLS